MTNIAAILHDLGPSQKSFYMIKEFNKLAALKDFSVSAFYSRPAMPVTKPFFSCRNIAFLSGFNGVALATSLPDADILLKSHNNTKKYLYLWDIEWLISPMSFSAASDVLLDERLNIITRSKSHASVIENFCNKKIVGIVDNWNLNQLLNLLTEENHV